MTRTSDGLEITAVPIFSDNYVWLIERAGRAVVVDPGQAEPVRAALEQRGLRLDAILITHHHPDHIGGVAELLSWTPVPVYGPRAEAGKIAVLSHLLDDGDTVDMLGVPAQVLAVPGHTLGHLAYHVASQRLLFCGDTLFAGGCGRLFEGTPTQMLGSLSRLAALPDDTAVYCAHEYTLSNLAFATAVEPANTELAAHLGRMRELRASNVPTVPSRIGTERAINPFLRTAMPAVKAAAQREAAPAQPADDAVSVFAALRGWKDRFRPSAAV